MQQNPTQQTTKTITLKDVLAVIDVAPVEILLKIKEKLDKALENKQEANIEMDVKRALLMNNSKARGPMPETSSMSAGPSSRSELMKSVQGPGVNLPETSSLRMQLEKMQTTGPPSSEMMEFDIVFLYADNYNTGYAAIKSEEALAEIKRVKAECANKGWYHPYGFGNANDLLKVKGLTGRKGERKRIKVRFKQWSNSSKSGYSCYYQK